MQILGPAHFALAIACLILGAAVFFQQKGGSRHRVLGYLYSGALLLVNLSALSVYEDSSGPGPFHVLALISLVTLTAGFVPAVLRRPTDSWLHLHAYFMSWSYVGLVAAGVAQMTTKLAGPGSLQVLIPTVSIVLVGALFIHARVPPVLSGVIQREARLAYRPPLP
jgi:uncharacterized membrane protein